MQLNYSLKPGCFSNKTPRCYNLQAFTFIVIFISILVLLRLVVGQQYAGSHLTSLEQLDVAQIAKRDIKCRLVHHAQDKCSFIKAYCPDEEAGLFSYLSLYYCDLRNVKPLAFIILSLWLALLFTTIGIAASDFFCLNLNTIATILGMSESIAGTTFLAFGNGSPDVFSTFAAMNSNSGNLAVGELIGAASFITAVVAGSMALVREFRVGRKNLVRDIGFFIVAVCLTILFLADGSLHLWECCVMVGFYFLYVVTVVVWHWRVEIRRKRREREAAARTNFVAMSTDEADTQDNDDHDEESQSRGINFRGTEDVNLLDQRSLPPLISYDDDDDENDEDKNHAIRLAAEMASNMRVTRPAGSRRNTLTPIRPSLVGALEFRSAFSYVQKSRQVNGRLSVLPRYYDDPATLGQFSDRDIDYFGLPVLTSEGRHSGIRAGSSGNVPAFNATDPEAPSNTTKSNFETAESISVSPNNLEIPVDLNNGLQSISGNLSPHARSRIRSRASRTVHLHERQLSDTPVLPEDGLPAVKFLLCNSAKKHNDSNDSMSNISKSIPQGIQHLRVQLPSSRDSSRSRLSSVSTFPTYFDPLIETSSRVSKAPSPILQNRNRLPESDIPGHGLSFPEKLAKWWPYQYFPSSSKIGCTFFPTLCTWKQKSMWDKFVSVISAPSIFLLAITLPVVEIESADDSKNLAELDLFLESTTSSRMPSRIGVPSNVSLEAQPEWLAYRRALENQVNPSLLHQSYEPCSNSTGEEFYHDAPNSLNCLNENIINSHYGLDSSSGDWDRWLVSIQIFTAPLFVALIIWANSAGDSYLLTKMILYSLVGSLIGYLILILTTSPNKVPKYRFILCFLGFVVSIAWISTIAGEVVGVLKTIGVILDISDAILGLTIFAVGNSLGDLVADITVARLGYPVMALSACFGGPMLNILLGIGLSGIYVTVSEANKKHTQNPDDRIKYKPYQIEVSGNLMISAVTLLVSLAGILIAVPLNKWIMSKRIGWGLIILWSVSTVATLSLEIGGLWGKT